MEGRGRAGGDQLVERHAPALARFAVSSGERNDIDELVQDTFVRAFDSLDGFRGESSFRTWLFTIERRLLARSPTRREATTRSDGDAGGRRGDGVRRARWRGGRRDAARLQRRGRAAVADAARGVRLRVAEGLSYKEIAEAVGTTEGAARVHYHNAMRAVKEFLDE